MSRVSVIIPTYNCATRLLEAIASVAAQTYDLAQIEIIVIDDGSTDDTAARVAERAAKGDVEIRYVAQANAGPSAARNHGFRLARGEYIAFLDADDLWMPTKLERQLPLFVGDVGLVYCDARFTDADGAPISNYVRKIPLERGDVRLALFCNFFILLSTVVITRALLERVGVFDENLAVGEDYEFFLRIARVTTVDVVTEKLIDRTVRPDSLSRKDFELDARIDLATLAKFLVDEPQFAQQHHERIRRRLARYRYDLGWQLREHGRFGDARDEFVQSLRLRPTLAALRAWLGTCVAALVSRS